MATVKSRHGEVVAEVTDSGIGVLVRVGRLGMILSHNEAHRLAAAIHASAEDAAREDVRRKAEAQT